MKTKILLIGGLIVAVFAGTYLALQSNEAIGSVTIGNGYHSTTTRSYNGTALTNLTVLQGYGGTLGSVVITGAAAGTINLYDATTTNSSLRTKAATTTIVTIPNNAASGTYTFDVVFYDGLIVELLGTVGTSTITYR